MRDLNKQEQTAIEAVARRFSTTWVKGNDPPTPISISLGNGLLLTSQPANGGALSKVAPPSLV
jgi:hypothetical protein